MLIYACSAVSCEVFDTLLVKYALKMALCSLFTVYVSSNCSVKTVKNCVFDMVSIIICVRHNIAALM